MILMASILVLMPKWMLVFGPTVVVVRKGRVQTVGVTNDGRRADAAGHKKGRKQHPNQFCRPTTLQLHGGAITLSTDSPHRVSIIHFTVWKSIPPNGLQDFAQGSVSFVLSASNAPRGRLFPATRRGCQSASGLRRDPIARGRGTPAQPQPPFMQQCREDSDVGADPGGSSTVRSGKGQKSPLAGGIGTAATGLPNRNRTFDSRQCADKVNLGISIPAPSLTRPHFSKPPDRHDRGPGDDP